MKQLLLSVAFLFFTFLLSAQHQADRWYFGNNAGINFNTGNPVAIPGALVTNEGTTSASDSSGSLRFYSDGMNVWNKYSVLMPNGTGLYGNISSTVSGMAVPYPGNDSLYYLFTMDEAMSPHGFCYSMIDMTLNNQAGDVTVKNVPVKLDVTEKVAAVSQLGTNNYWVSIHEWGTDAFYSYLVNSSGFQSTPVISHSGMVHTIDPLEQNKYGQMKFNTCGTKAALGIGYLDTVQVFDFDPATAIYSNPITIPIYDHVYGVEFSQNGNVLYVTSYNIPSEYSQLTQYDLSSGNQATIIASGLVIGYYSSSTNFYYALQLAPDGKIYLCKSFSQYLGVVDNPDNVGITANYQDFGFDLDPSFNGNQSALGLPAFIQSYFRGEINCVAPTGINDHAAVANISVLNNPSSDEFALHIPADLKIKAIAVFDNAGKLIESKQDIHSVIYKFGKNYAPGMYILKAQTDSRSVSVKLIKTE